MCQASSGTAQEEARRTVTTFCTASRAHLRRARPTSRADLAKDAQDQHGERERAEECPLEARVEGDSRRWWRGSLARFLQRDSAPSRAAARRADARHPAAAAPRRSAPWVPALRELAGLVVARQVRLSPGERSQVPGRALSVSARLAAVLLKRGQKRTPDRREALLGDD
jgi:hypothetical protein